MNNQELRDIPGYEGRYAATTDGQIWSHLRKKFLSPETLWNGYERVCLIDADGKKNHMRVHRAVLMAYNPVEGMENLDANHLDEDTHNNKLSNLCWMTRKENINYGTRNERAGKKLAKVKSKKIYCIELDRVFNSQKEAAKELDLNAGNISSCCTGRYKQTNGYHFCFWSE